MFSILGGDPGWSTPAEDIAMIGNSSFNTLMPYWAPANETLLDMIDAAGLQVLFSTKDSYTMKNSEAFVKAQVAEWKDHAAVLGWCVRATVSSVCSLLPCAS